MQKLLLCLILFFTHFVYAQNVNSLNPTQVYNTGNLTTFNQNGSQTTTPWQNVGQWGGQLQCWAPGNPGYCGPNPYVNASGNGVINFSYGYTDLFQVVNIASALPNSGTGLRVNGFNFGFMAKNGNGWDNGQQDFLVAYVNFYDNKGQLAQNYNYGAQTNQKYNWTQFNFSETFTTPYASKDLSTARYGFAGYDTNFWAGPYGPEIYNVSFSLKYSVDPCFNNVLYSPTCPGYLDALAKLSPPAPTTTAATDTNTQNTNTIIQPNPPTATAQTTTSPSTNTSSSPTTAPTPAPTTTTTATATATASSPRETTNNNGLSIGLSVVARNQQREQSIAMQAAQNAVAAADQAAQQTQQDALNIAQTSSANSIVNPSNPASRVTGVNVQKQDQSLTQSSTTSSLYSLVLQPNVQQNSVRSVDTSKLSTTMSTQEISTGQSVTSLSQTGIVIETQPTISLLPPQPMSQSTQQNPIVASQTMQSSLPISQPMLMAPESTTIDSQKFLTDRTNPLYQALENKSIETQNNMTMQQGPAVNKNAQNNELAGGVDITRMALAPSGYNEYLNFTLRDAAFYAPKEVYRNQRNVDNVRALRQLSSDRLHQEMVEQQYRR